MSRRLRLVVPAIALGFAAGLTSCSDDPGEGPPANTQPPASNSSGAPKVQNPLDVQPFLADPCRLVDDQTIQSIGEFEAGKPDVNSDEAKKLIGPSCDWLAAVDFGNSVGVVIETVHQQQAAPGLKGIDGIYASKADGMIDYLQPVELPSHPGYPAVIAGQQADMSAGECNVYIGVADDLRIRADVANEKAPDQACPAAQQVAGAVLNALKKGS